MNFPLQNPVEIAYVIEAGQTVGDTGFTELIAASGQTVQPHYDLWGQILATKVLLQGYEATGKAAYRELLAERGVAIQPGYLYDLPYDGALVLSLLTPPSVWQGGLRTLFSALAEWTE